MTQACKKILVVDDERELAEVMRRVLSRKGFEVRVAFGGFEGLKVAAEFMPDLILSDVVMPEGTGYELLKGIKNSEREPPPIVLLMTGYTDLSEQDLVNAGALRVFQKPVDINTLLEFISSTTNQS